MFFKSILNFKLINCFLIGIIPLFLITGPALSDIAISISGILTLILIFYKKDWSYFNNKFFLFFLLWCLYLIIISVFSNHKINSLESSLFYFRFGIFSLSVWYLLESNYKGLFILILKIILIFCFTILIFDSLFQYFFSFNTFGFPYNGSRLSSFFGEEYKLGSYFSRMIPLLFAITIFNFYNNKYEYYFCIFALFFSDTIIFLSGERTAFFYAILFSLAVVFLIKKYRLVRILTIISSFFLLLLISLNSNDVKLRMIDRTIEQTSETTNIFTFTTQHNTVYQTSLKIFKDNFIFGIGPKNFRIVCNQSKYETLTKFDRSINGCQAHPHNSYIQLLTETGIVGSIPLILIFIFLTYYFFKHFYLKLFYKKITFSDKSLFFLIALYISVWPLAPNGNFFGNWLSIIYYFPVGFLLYNYSEHKKKINKII